MALLLGIVWFAGNNLIEYYFRPKIQEVRKDIEVLKQERAGLYARLHQDKVRLFTKVFTERYDPRQEDLEDEEQLMRIYNRYAADDTRFLTYLFSRHIPDYSAPAARGGDPGPGKGPKRPGCGPGRAHPGAV